MRARGVHTYRDYSRVLDADTHEYDRLLDALTINVTRFFRNPEAWEALDALVPALLTAAKEPLRVWSAGCASGEEPYTLAMLFHRRAAALGRRARAVEIIGTDIDKASLDTAERGVYEPAALADMPDDARRAYFARRPAVHRARRGARARAPRAARPARRGRPGRPVRSDRLPQRHDLLRPQVAGSAAREFHGALAPGGLLVQGKVETLVGAARPRFETVDARERIFRRAP